MIRSCRRIVRGSRYLLAFAVVGLVLSIMVSMGCGESRFEVGDKVGVPPLPPSDTILGIFEKTVSSDATGSPYRLKDLPENGVEQPVGLSYGGSYRLFFTSGLAGDDLQLIPTGTSGLANDDVVVAPGANAKLETLVVGDDEISIAIVPGLNDNLNTPSPPGPLSVDDVYSTDANYILPGPNGVIDTTVAWSPPGEDDRIGMVILPGPDGIADSPHAIRYGTVRPASPYISTGPNGIAESGLGPGDIQVNSVGTDSLDPQDSVVVGPGLDTILQTLPANDDVLVDAVLPGGDGNSNTANVPDDVRYDQYILPGPNGVLDTTTPGGDDMLGKIIAPGTDGVADSGLADGDIQGEIVVIGDQYIAENGIRVGQGEPNRKAVSVGGNGKADTICIYDDNTIFDEDYHAVRIENANGIFTGRDGIAQSGLGGDDVQVVPAGKQMDTVGGVVIKGGADGLLDTIPGGGDDVQVLAPGTATGSDIEIGVTVGLDGTLTTCPAGDDTVILPKIIIDTNKRVDTVAYGDDIAIYPYLEAYDFDGKLFVPVTPIILPGANQKLDTFPFIGDKWLNNNLNPSSSTPTIGDALTVPVITAGQNRRIDTVVPDDLPAIIDRNDGFADSGLRGDDIQILSAGLEATSIVLPVIGSGLNNTLETAPNGDDVEMVYDLNWPFGGLAETTAEGDDIQVVPVGSPSIIVVSPTEAYPVPIILPGPNGVIDSTVGGNDWLVIGEYGSDFATFKLLAIGTYGDLGIGAFTPDPAPNGVAETGLGGRGALDLIAMCNATLDNGGTFGVDDPWDFDGDTNIDVVDYSVYKARAAGCPDDYQPILAGQAAGSEDVIIHSGLDSKLDTFVVDGDVEAIIDGGNGVAESGIGAGEEQLIPIGQGKPATAAVIAAQDRMTGVVRELNTRPAGDDVIVNPGKSDLSGNKDFDLDNNNTPSDPDGDGQVENVAAVDDGEFFSWAETNLSNVTIPMPTTNVPFASGFVKNMYSFDVIDNPDGNGLVAYVSNGMNIYRTTSADGVTWNALDLVLEPGGKINENAPVVLSGVDGICDTAAEGDDVQNIAVGKGLANTIGIFAGKDGTLQSVIGGDDKKDGKVIRTGKNGIRESVISGDDWEVVAMGEGQADAACVVAGNNGRRDTSDASIGLSDDRPPFFDLNKNASTVFLPEAGEPAVTEGGWAGFDALAVTHPSIFRHGGNYYMFYTGWGAATEPEPKRPDSVAFKQFGPCLRPGLDRTLTTKLASLGDYINEPANDDNDASVLLAPRIGLATSSNGKDWKKLTNPVIGAGRTCTGVMDLSIVSALGIDLEDLGMSPFMLGSMDFDYMGAMSPAVRSDPGADDEPVFSMVYTGFHFMREGESFDGMSPNANTGREQFGGLKTGIGLARSFDVKNDWTKLKDYSPVFGAGLFYENLAERTPTVLSIGNGYVAYYVDHIVRDAADTTDDDYYISIAKRYGTVYGMCMTVKKISGTDTGRVAVGLLLILLPAVVLITRKAWLKIRK